MIEITGTILKIKDRKDVSLKFTSREVWITTEKESKYPQTITVQLTQDRCDLIDSFVIGDEVKLSVNLKGRLWTSKEGEEKVFNTLEVFRIEHLKTKYIQKDEPEVFGDNRPLDSVGDLDLPF